MLGDMPAFPGAEFYANPDKFTESRFIQVNPGISQRALIAAKAMEGLLSDITSLIKVISLGYREVGGVVAQMSVKAADALLKELEKKQ